MSKIGKIHINFPEKVKVLLNDNNIITETKKYIKNTLENADLILKNININKDYLLNYSKMILGRDK